MGEQEEQPPPRLVPPRKKPQPLGDMAAVGVKKGVAERAK